MCNLCRRECRVQALKRHKCSGWLGHGCRVVGVVTLQRVHRSVPLKMQRQMPMRFTTVHRRLRTDTEEEEERQGRSGVFSRGYSD